MPLKKQTENNGMISFDTTLIFTKFQLDCNINKQSNHLN